MIKKWDANHGGCDRGKGDSADKDITPFQAIIIVFFEDQKGEKMLKNTLSIKLWAFSNYSLLINISFDKVLTIYTKGGIKIEKEA